ncbi:MAG: PAS domain S-box protein [Methanomicrobiales archaeon]
MIRVLFVDDESALLELYRMYLGRSGEFEVRCAASGAEALERLSTGDVEVVVSDYQMPGMDGLALLQEVRRDSDLPFIIFTGRGREEVAIEALNLGADFYLQKGTDTRAQFAELAHVIRQVVARRRAEEAYKTVLRYSGTAIYVVEEDGTISYCNDAFLQLSGYSREEIVGRRSWHLFIDPADHPLIREYHHRRRKDPESAPESYRYTLIDRKGERHRVHITIGIIPGTGRSIASLHDITPLVEAREAREQSDERLQMAMDAARVGIFEIDLRTGSIILSDPVYTLFGYDPGELDITLDGWEGLVHPEDVDRIHREVLDTPVGARPFGVEFRIPDSSGEWQWISVRSGPTEVDSAGNPVRIAGVIADISDQKKAEEMLARRESYYQALFQNAGDAITLRNLDGVILEANPAALEMLGRGREEVIGRNYIDFVDPSCIHHLQRVVGQLRAAGYAEYEATLRHRTGSPVQVDSRCRILDDADDAPFIICIARDITWKRQEEERQQQNERLFRTLFEEALNPILVVDTDGRFLTANTAGLDFLECGREDLRGTTVRDWMSTGEGEDGILSLFEPHRTMETEWRVGNRIKTLLLNVVPITIDDMTMYYGIGQDITELKNAQISLETANRNLNLLNQVLRHDMMNQVNIMGGYLELLAGEMGDGGEVTSYVRRCRQALKTIERQIAIARDYQNLRAQEPRWQDPGAVFRRCLDDEAGLGEGISVTVDCDGVEIFADPMLEKALCNLVQNACTHARGMTRLAVTGTRDGDDLLIAVTDDGCGIPDEKKTTLFTPDPGSIHGYGLSLVREILAITGMTITETGTPGGGARFEIRVPGESWRISGN